ncbi:MAG: tetratricopeptide repeat protein [Magnetococcales bacterium]|nr:tetratricopeptide repeat protein [Magnetococcales bacterium]
MSARELYREGQLLLTEGEAPGCITMVSGAIEIGGMEVPWLMTRAVAHLQLGQYAEAMADCDEMMRLDVENPQLYFLRGTLCRRMNRAEDAIANLTQAIQIDPNYAIAYLERAICFMQCQRTAEAEEDLRWVVMCNETALQGFGDEMGMMRTQQEAVEAMREGERDYPRLRMPEAEVEEMLRVLQ